MKIYLGQTEVECVEARTPLEQQVGLCALPTLADGQGMVFFYANEDVRTFWMPESMRYAIDILFVDANSKVARIATNCTPGSRFRFTGRAKWVVEVPAGFARRSGIVVGTPVGFGAPAAQGVVADQCSDRLRGITTAELYAMRDARFEEASMADIVAQSTETQPYQRAPSVAPSAPLERFRDRQIPADNCPDAGSGFVQEVIRDESWNSPTRPF